MKLRKNQSVITILKHAWKLMSWCKRHESVNAGLVRCYTCGGWFDPDETDLGHYEHQGMSSNGYGTNMIDWEERGLRVQCKPCNHDPHRKVLAAKAFTRKLIAEYGDAIIDELAYIKNRVFLPSIAEAQEKLEKSPHQPSSIFIKSPS